MKIYFHVSGRLGNQLFQWAFLHELIEQGYEVTLFIDKYHNSNLVVDIDRLLPNCSHLSQVEIRNGLGQILRLREKLESLGGVFLALSRCFPVYIESLPKIRRKNFLPRIVDGYFIDKFWVEKHQTKLLPELSKTLASIEESSRLELLLQKEPTTRTHVRRGDLNAFKSTFGLLSSHYYASLISLDEPVFILTDSLEEAKELLKDFHEAIFIDPMECQVWEALVILSKSKKFVMSNSTLGWWAGFLARNLNSAEVFMPRPFYTSESKFDALLHLEGFLPAESSFE